MRKLKEGTYRKPTDSETEYVQNALSGYRPPNVAPFMALGVGIATFTAAHLFGLKAGVITSVASLSLVSAATVVMYQGRKAIKDGDIDVVSGNITNVSDGEYHIHTELGDVLVGNEQNFPKDTSLRPDTGQKCLVVKAKWKCWILFLGL
ncbi:MAG: hypothetical protein J5966_05930 [Lachnospiraceae bacterium]|nr:hypothetical protein [Lachnospiraceae bacterium]